MIEHLVIFKWKPETTAAAIAAAIKGLKDLKNEIKGIVDLTVGENFSERSQGYSLGLVVRFTDKAALAYYADHPLHQGVVSQCIKPHLESLIAVDYEI